MGSGCGVRRGGGFRTLRCDCRGTKRFQTVTTVLKCSRRCQGNSVAFSGNGRACACPLGALGLNGLKSGERSLLRRSGREVVDFFSGRRTDGGFRRCDRCLQRGRGITVVG